MNNLEPVVGQWYRPVQKGRSFQVVAFEPDNGTIEIQKFDGDVDEWDMAAWRATQLETIPEPEEWTGPVDDIGRDDLPDDDASASIEYAPDEALNQISPGMNTHEVLPGQDED
ncbi:MAG TPA: DUF6763 family protein [Steroidobacteraceae bacterium]|nr:DUF6763 family protein [Steroidobacteraceae bacterium]